MGKACCSLTRLTTNMRNTAGIRSSFQVSVLCFFALALCAGALSHESKTEESHAPPATVKSPVEADDQSPEALVDSDLDEDDEDADDDEDKHSKVHVGRRHITIGRGPNAMKIKLHGHGGRSHVSHHASKMSHVRHTGGHRHLGQGRHALTVTSLTTTEVVGRGALAATATAVATATGCTVAAKWVDQSQDSATLVWA